LPNENLCEDLHCKVLSIKDCQAGHIQERLEGAKLTGIIRRLLSKLWAVHLMPVAVDRSGEDNQPRGPVWSADMDMDLAQVESLILKIKINLAIKFKMAMIYLI
jgi:hypothetical protein